MENPIGKKIAQRLNEMGKTQVWLADQMGVAGVSVHNWITKGTISRENVVKVSKVLQVSLDDLWGHNHAAAGPSTALEPSAPADANLVEDPTPPQTHERNDLFLNYVSRDEMRLISIYREKGQYRQMLDLIIDCHEKQA